MLPWFPRLLSALAAAATALAPLCAHAAASAPTRPNFIFFLTDDQAIEDTGYGGNTVLKTPAMDRLAAEGVVFKNAFVTTAICCCSRASILTGQHMRRHGIEDFEKPLTTQQLQQTFPVLLRGAGYRTAFLGKFAVGSPKIDPALSLPADLFDLWYGFPQSIAFKQTENGKDRYLTTVMTEKAAQFLKETPLDQPFCMMVALKEPHGPLTYFDPEFTDSYADATIPAPQNLTRESFDALPEPVRKSLAASAGWIDKPAGFQALMRRKYAYIARADLAIAQIRAALEASGHDKNTVIVFMGDHGVMNGAHALTGKWVMYEESIRTPFVIRDPRLPKDARGQRTQMVLNIDLAPTFLAMAGVPIPASMQGEDLQAILRNPAAVGRKDWFYEHTYTPGDGRRGLPKIEGVRTERWKYTRYTESRPALEELFDLKTDPHEEKNLASASEFQSTLQQLRTRCDEYRVSLK